ncbi:hypothetical protein [Paenibacillus riograndensis]|uniref:hypothetical protein n=1 Tax=Paenibacillus riograndensis TaxID=483937 RepID=UPI000625980B|nr:hypothetical protein [Paenibacillus riograndensis]
MGGKEYKYQEAVRPTRLPEHGRFEVGGLKKSYLRQWEATFDRVDCFNNGRNAVVEPPAYTRATWRNER